MSWNGYVDSLVNSKQVEKAAICGLDGTIWAKSSDLDLTPAEVAVLLGGFTKPDQLRAKGFYLGGERYVLLQSDETQMQGRKKNTGCAVARSGGSLIIGLYGPDQQGGGARKAVETIRDHLLNSGY